MSWKASSMVSFASQFSFCLAREGLVQYSGRSPGRRATNLCGRGLPETFSKVLTISRTEVGLPVARL